MADFDKWVKKNDMIVTISPTNKQNMIFTDDLLKHMEGKVVVSRPHLAFALEHMKSKYI